MSKGERILGVVLILIGIAVSVNSYTALGFGSITQPGSGFFPLICGVGVTTLSAVWMFISRKSETKSEPLWKKGQWIRPITAVGIIGAYIALLELVGYVLSTITFVLLWQFLVEHEKWKKTIMISVIMTACMYILFVQLLAVPLPKGIFA